MWLECPTACFCLMNCHENMTNILQNDHLLFEVIITAHSMGKNIVLPKFKKFQIHIQTTYNLIPSITQCSMFLLVTMLSLKNDLFKKLRYSI